VLDDLILLEDLVQDLQRASAFAHIVFADDLKPIDDRLLIENVPVVGTRRPMPMPRLVYPLKRLAGMSDHRNLHSRRNVAPVPGGTYGNKKGPGHL
jgi:hypothetical protein